MADAEKTPVDQLVDLFVYAPVGLIYEYPAVMNRLVARGKSQVQLAKVFSQMAAGGKEATPQETVQRTVQMTLDQAASGALGDVAASVAKGVTELSALVGLTPSRPASPLKRPASNRAASTRPEPANAAKAVAEAIPAVRERSSDEAAKPTGKTKAKATATARAKPRKKATAVSAGKPAATRPSAAAAIAQEVPLAGYDEMTARAIVSLLGDLSESERASVGVYEAANKGRKTVLGKIDQLDSNESSP